MPRKKAAILNCAIIAVVGVLAAGSADSSSFFGGIKVMGRGFFDLFDFISSNICLPLGGLFIALYAGYKMKEKDLRDELTNHGKLNNEGKVILIRFLLRYVTPLLVLIIFLNSVGVLKF